MRNEVERYHCERHDERVDHELGNLQHDGVAKGQRKCHEAHAQRRQDVAGDFRATQLVDDEAIDRIRNRYAVNEHHREDGEPVDDGEDDAVAAAEEVGEYREDVLAVQWRVANDPGERAVGQVGHREDEQGSHQQRDEAEAAGRNRQEEDACTYGGAEERDGPLAIDGLVSGHLAAV